MVVDPTEPSFGPDDIDLLFRYYQIIKQDLLTQTGYVKNHVRNSQIIGGALVAGLTFLSGYNNFQSLNSPILPNNIFIWLVGLVTFTTVIYYLAYDVLEAVFAVRALETCLVFLEDRLNSNLGANRLVWQSGVAKNLWPIPAKEIGVAVPMLGLSFYGGLLVLGATFVLPSFIYYKIWLLPTTEDYLKAILCALECYSIGSVVAILLISRSINETFPGKVRKMVAKKWELVLASDSMKSRTKREPFAG
jgi:hypothetical protein